MSAAHFRTIVTLKRGPLLCIYIYIYVYAYVCMYVCMYVCIYNHYVLKPWSSIVSLSMICTCICLYNVYICKHICTYTYPGTHHDHLYAVLASPLIRHAPIRAARIRTLGGSTRAVSHFEGLCIYIYIYAICIYMYMYIYIYIYVCICICIYIYIYMPIYVCRYVCMCVLVGRRRSRALDTCVRACAPGSETFSSQARLCVGLAGLL